MSDIKLSDFIAETLINISDGVRRAQDYTFENDGVPIAPPDLDGNPMRDGDQLVRFSVNVDVSTAQELAGGGKIGGPIIRVIAGEINADASKSQSTTTSQHIEFAVPVNFNLRYRKHMGEGD